MSTRNEIKNNALAFAREWKDESPKDAEAKSFWDAFLTVFWISHRRVASLEKPVKKSDGKDGFTDLLWKGVLPVEHKSRGKDLDRAFHQATDHFYGTKERDLPRYVLISDFARFRLYDLEADDTREFTLQDLHEHVGLFGFIAAYRAHVVKERKRPSKSRRPGPLCKSRETGVALLALRLQQKARWHECAAHTR